MVHVLTGVLQKVSHSLRNNGILLIIQPAQANVIIRVEMDGRVVFNEDTVEPRFQKYLDATREAIGNVVEVSGKFAELSKYTINRCRDIFS